MEVTPGDGAGDEAQDCQNDVVLTDFQFWMSVDFSQISTDNINKPVEPHTQE